MINRRIVTFGSLALAASPAVGVASEPHPTQVAALEPVIALTRIGHTLHVDLAARNRSAEPVDLLVAWGSRPAPDLRVALQVDGEAIELARVFDVDRREVMTRAGPRPRWAPIAVNETADIGRYAFTLPEGVEDDERCVVVGELTTQAAVVPFRREGLTWRTSLA